MVEALAWQSGWRLSGDRDRWPRSALRGRRAGRAAQDTGLQRCSEAGRRARAAGCAERARGGDMTEAEPYQGEREQTPARIVMGSHHPERDDGRLDPDAARDLRHADRQCR